MNDHDEERINNALADGLIDGDDTYEGKLTPTTRAREILAALPNYTIVSKAELEALRAVAEAGWALSDYIELEMETLDDGDGGSVMSGQTYLDHERLADTLRLALARLTPEAGQ